MPDSIPDTDIFNHLLVQRGVDIDQVEQFVGAHDFVEPSDADFVTPDTDPGASVVPSLEQYDPTMDHVLAERIAESNMDDLEVAQASVMAALPPRRPRTPVNTAPTPNRVPGQTRPVNTSYLPRGTGRNRVDPSVGMVEANITDVFPVRIARCNCPILDRNEAEWLNPAQNTHGQSIRLQARVMPEVERFFQHVIAARLFPYKTIEDVIRHAINRHVIWLDNQEPVEGHLVHVIEGISMITREEQIRASIEETLPEAMKVIRDYAERGYLTQANSQAQRVYAQLNEMRDGPHKDMMVQRFCEFLDKLVDEVDRRYPSRKELTK